MLSIIIPAHFEEKNIGKTLAEIEKKVKTSYEVLVVYDLDDDPTVRVVRGLTRSRVNAFEKNKIMLIKNFVGNGRGVINAFKSGLQKAKGEAVVVVMADLSDDLAKIDSMYRLIEKGYDIVCGSRYMKGGQQIGGPMLKGFLSRMAGLTAHYLFGLPMHDPTNAFKMFKKNIFNRIEIESSGGFEYNLEVIVKAHKLRMKISEVPATWRDRAQGKSKFKLLKWLPKYIKWYLFLLKH